MNRSRLLALAMLVDARHRRSAFAQPAAGAKVKVTQSHLVPTCLDGTPTGDKRTWTMASGDHTMAVHDAERAPFGSGRRIRRLTRSGHGDLHARGWSRLRGGGPRATRRRSRGVSGSGEQWTSGRARPDRRPHRQQRSTLDRRGMPALIAARSARASSASSRVTRPSSCWTTARTVDGSLRSTPAPFSRRIG